MKRRLNLSSSAPSWDGALGRAQLHGIKAQRRDVRGLRRVLFATRELIFIEIGPKDTLYDSLYGSMMVSRAFFCTSANFQLKAWKILVR